MRAAIILGALALAGCEAMERDVAESNKEKLDHFIEVNTTVRCIDGNQIRFVIGGLTGRSASYTAWPILQRDGRPVRCKEPA